VLQLRRISDWSDSPCIVAASGPSLTNEVAAKVRRAQFAGWRVLVVNDAYRQVRSADALYATDFAWWSAHNGARDFLGERWTSHSTSMAVIDDKSLVAHRYDLNFVLAKHGKGFSKDPQCIHYGSPEHSGFQAVNLAILAGAKRIVLVGFDYGYSAEPHFFGAHPMNLRQPKAHEYADMARAFDSVETNVQIDNATSGSGLKKFPMVDLDEALRRDDRVHRNGSLADACADRSCEA
jgi:hypothetical protein